VKSKNIKEQPRENHEKRQEGLEGNPKIRKTVIFATHIYWGGKGMVEINR